MAEFGHSDFTTHNIVYSVQSVGFDCDVQSKKIVHYNLKNIPLMQMSRKISLGGSDRISFFHKDYKPPP